jgi:DNA-binding CsgD family transcriptional regulator
MPAIRSVALTLVELRALARPRQRRRGSPDAASLLLRLLGTARLASFEDRPAGLVFKFAGETEQHSPFSLTCVLHAPGKPDQLTPAERAVADLLCEGHTLARIAQVRGVSANTVKSQVRQLFRKLNVDTRVALVRRWCP